MKRVKREKAELNMGLYDILKIENSLVLVYPLISYEDEKFIDDNYAIEYDYLK